MIGGAIFKREAFSVARRPRTYALQTIFLGALTAILIAMWPASSASVTGTGGQIFRFGVYLQVILVALLAPASTAGAITVEKSKNTLGLLLLTDAGPFSIVLGKVLARAAALVFLLLLSLPVVFAVLTLGGISAKQIGVAAVIILTTAWVGCALGAFFSTVMKKTPGALIAGYVFMGAYLFLPSLLELAGYLPHPVGAGNFTPRGGWFSPVFDIFYLFDPQKFVASESFPQTWWVNPAANVVAGTALLVLSAAILPKSKDIDRALDVRRFLDGTDRFLSALMPGAKSRKAAEARRGPAGNPIYWKETTVNTLGRFKHWWRVNLLLTLLLVGSYWVFSKELMNIQFHQVVCAVLSSILILASTVISANAVAKEREERTLEVLATTPIECAMYIQGKVAGILRNIVFLVVLPLAHVVLFTAFGPIHPVSLVLIIAFPVAAIVSILQGILVSLMFPTTLRAMIAAIGVVALEAALPFCCCLPSFNLPLLGYYAIADSGRDFEWALFFGTIFSTLAHAGLMLVIYSLIRSGYDRYIGRAG